MKTKLLTLGAMAAGALALPFALPAAAHADSLRVGINLGTPVVYQPAPVYYRPVVYRPAPRVVYVPRRVGWAHSHHHRWHEARRYAPYTQQGYMAYRW